MSGAAHPALVLLHGFTGAPASWDEVVALLPADAAVVQVTLLGHGETTNDTATDFDAEVERVARRLVAQGIEGAHLVGYSLGARVALGLALRHPAHFCGVTLIGVHPGLASSDERAARTAGDERWAVRLEREGIEAFVAAWERQPLFALAGPIDERRLARQRAIRLAHRASGLARSLRILGLGRMPDFRQTIARGEVALRLVAGAADARFRALAEEIVRLSPCATLSVVEDSGHNVVLEQPTRLAALLQRAPPSAHQGDAP